MADFNGILAQQTVHFRGTSTFDLGSTIPNWKAISKAVYTARVFGGVSGSFSVQVLGTLGQLDHIICGLTALSSTGGRFLYPRQSAPNGAQQALEVALGDTSFTWIDTMPPSKVIVQSGNASSGISASITVSAIIHGGD